MPELPDVEIFKRLPWTGMRAAMSWRNVVVPIREAWKARRRARCNAG